MAYYGEYRYNVLKQALHLLPLYTLLYHPQPITDREPQYIHLTSLKSLAAEASDINMDRRSDSIPNRHKGRKINPTTTNTKWIKSERYFISYACRKSAMSSNVCTFDRDGLIRLLQQRGLPESSITVVLHPLPINWSCGRVAYKNGWCIFHAEDKDPMDFDKALIQELNNMMKQNKYDFTGFVFPGIPDTLIKSLNTNAKPAYFIGATF
jgi:hypothetical protein